VLGIVLRLLALHQPLVDAHTFRQCQTADATRSLITEPGWHLSSSVSWKGDSQARLLQELPVYNYLAAMVHAVTGRLDQSGKLVSVALWALSFCLLQGLWRRLVPPRAAFWGNLLFVLAPLEVFFGQAFMPEMLIQVLAFGFLWASFRYVEQPTWSRWLVCALAGLLGLVVKFPETAHWYLVLAFLLFQKERWRCLWRPRYVIAALVTIAAVKGWSLWVARVNQAGFPDWMPQTALASFLGTFGARFRPGHFTMIAKYQGLFIFSPVGLGLAALGLWELIRRRTAPSLCWLGALAVFHLVWAGPASSGQSYYNLPAVGPGCMLFGLGMVRWLDGVKPCWGEGAPRWAAAIVLVLLLPALAAGSLYQFQPDRVTYESALWVRDHTGPNDLILFKCNHRLDGVNYPHNCTFPYYAQRRAWVYTQEMPETERERAVTTSQWAVVTRPPTAPSTLEKWRRRFRYSGAELAPDNMNWLTNQAGFALFYQGASFTVYRKGQPL
jgi:hypothetical protein